MRHEGANGYCYQSFHELEPLWVVLDFADRLKRQGCYVERKNRLVMFRMS